MKEQIKRLQNKTLLISAIVVLLLSFIPRFYDIGSVLPQYAIDENDLVEPAVGFWGGDIDIYWYRYGPLYYYILSITYLVQSLFSTLDIDQFAQNVFFNSESFYYTGRLIQSLLNILLAFFTYRLAKNNFNNRIVGIVLFLSLFPFFDLLVGFRMCVDTLLALLSLIVITLSIKLYTEKKIKYYLLTGIFWGLSFSTKPLLSLLILPTVLLAHMLSVNNLKSLFNLFSIKRILFLVFGAILPLIINPYPITKAKDFINQQIDTTKNYGMNQSSPLGIGKMFDHSLGFAFTIIGIVALFYVTRKVLKEHNRLYYIIISYPIVYILALAGRSIAPHLYIPIVPVIIICVAIFVYNLFAMIKCARIRAAATYIILFFLILEPSVNLVKRSIKLNSYREAHTCVAAKKWIEQNISTNSKLFLLGWYSSLPHLVDFDPQRQSRIGEYFMYYRHRNKYLVQQFFKAHALYLKEQNPVFYIEQYRAIRYDKLISYLRNKGFEYLISSQDLKRKLPQLNPKIVKVFDRKQSPFGPTVTVYRLN